MPPGLTSLYAEFRLQSGAVLVLRDDGECPPEHLLQSLWQHQRLRRDLLRTLDGQPVRILHPGFQNRESGPDFHGAVIQFGDDPPRSGDVEVDLRSSGWHSHGHDRNPAFQNVILHAVWESERAGVAPLPTLALRPVLDAPIGELSLWLGGEGAEVFPEELCGKCCAPLRELGPEQRLELLHQAAQVRFQGKAAKLQARAREAGWEQALWEGLFRGLGYKRNVWPMQRLAELRPRWGAANERVLSLQARLFGVGGLLPSDLPGTAPRRRARKTTHMGAGGSLDIVSGRSEPTHARRIWDLWWRERDGFGDCILPRSLWRFNGIRPANRPERRLALAAHWLAKGELPGALEKWCDQEISDAALARSLGERLQVVEDDFWSWHWTFESARLKEPQPLLGPARLTDLAVNVILPWLWIRAAEGKNEGLRNRVQHRYFAWPAAEDNAVLKLARRRLFGEGLTRGRVGALGGGAAAQQGLIQIVRDFCDHANSVCEGCKLPELASRIVRSE